MALRGNRIAVVGGGAAGLAAAVTAARSGARVDVLEAHDRVGNSIKVTGDGRCNIGNAQVRPDDYRNAAFVRQAFQACSPEDVRGFLESLGLLLRQEAEGRLYPYTNKSTSVIDALRLAARRAGVYERCGVAVSAVVPEAAGWGIRQSDGSSRRYDRVVLASGGSTQPDLLPKSVSFHAMQPVLGPLATDTQPLRGLDKIRVRCALQSGGYREVGEATFRNYGISGIAAFNMSRFMRKDDMLYVDFLPDIPAGRSVDYLQERLAMLDAQTWLDYTCGMLLPLVARAVLRAAGLSPEARPQADELPAFRHALHAFPLAVRGIGDVKLCQARRGGVDVASVDPATMRVCDCPGLYAVGEMLDVDGPCGGYNLHWAWTSGIIAGRNAARD